jgi:hypothetical protein
VAVVGGVGSGSGSEARPVSIALASLGSRKTRPAVTAVCSFSLRHGGSEHHYSRARAQNDGRRLRATMPRDVLEIQEAGLERSQWSRTGLGRRHKVEWSRRTVRMRERTREWPIHPKSPQWVSNKV